MKKLLLLFPLVLFSGSAFATHEGWKLLRRSDPPLRFEYPPTWIEKTPRGENVKALVSSNDPGTGANCNVLVRAELELEGIGPREAIAEVGGPAGVGAMLSQGQSGSTVVWSRESALDNRPAALVLMSVKYSTVKGTFEAQQLTLWSLVDGKIIQMTCSSLASEFTEVEPTFIEIMSSLVLESWKE